ncbi:PTS sugar transporter subunit IIA [Oceanobacillus jeddahense]|uniref:PTS sugar transporter subunit IIA n=1 Tax=Oceanobacillus jeddahense TaxID=1462527 RepID=UPI0005958B80|nr:PTS sugar transporter subunit IIA [Oceanobacillus jeddahense]
MDSIKSLFDRELIFIEDAQDQEEVFNRIGKILYEKEIVHADFIEGLIERECEHPTGLDLSPVADDISNVAIPHTEIEYCRSKNIVFVKLNKPIMFYNMIVPEQKIAVKYLFFIINNEKSNQTNVLSELMGFLTVPENIKHLETLKTNDDIYQFLTKQMIKN